MYKIAPSQNLYRHYAHTLHIEHNALLVRDSWSLKNLIALLITKIYLWINEPIAILPKCCM
jgi:hypothetical protein